MPSPAFPQRRTEGANSDFARAYLSHAHLKSILPCSSVLSVGLEEDGHLWIDVEAVTSVGEYEPILCGLAKGGASLRGIHVTHDGRARAVPALFRSTITQAALFKCITQVARASGHLTVLDFSGLQMSHAWIVTLTLGLKNAHSLRSLSFARCKMGESNFETILSCVRGLSSLRVLNLADNNLTFSACFWLSDLLFRRSLAASTSEWANNLRRDAKLYRGQARGHSRPKISPYDTTPCPLQRLNLCVNPIGDEGAQFFVEALREDIGLQALDLQKCNLTGASVEQFQDVLGTNPSLLILDMHNNPAIPHELLARILREAKTKQESRHTWTTFEWLDPHDPLSDTFHVSPSKTWRPPEGSERSTFYDKAVEDRNAQRSAQKPTPPLDKAYGLQRGLGQTGSSNQPFPGMRPSLIPRAVPIESPKTGAIISPRKPSSISFKSKQKSSPMSLILPPLPASPMSQSLPTPPTQSPSPRGDSSMHAPGPRSHLKLQIPHAQAPSPSPPLSSPRRAASPSVRKVRDRGARTSPIKLPILFEGSCEPDIAAPLDDNHGVCLAGPGQSSPLDVMTTLLTVLETSVSSCSMLLAALEKDRRRKSKRDKPKKPRDPPL